MHLGVDCARAYSEKTLSSLLKVAQNSFQHFPRQVLVGDSYHSLSIDATIMVSKNCPITGEHVGVYFRDTTESL